MENNLSQEENKYMVLNNAESIKHHAEELENAAKKSKHIPAWAVAKIYNASENLSGVTHFIDSSNKMPKEQYERIQEQINEEVKNEYAQGGGIEDYIQLQSNIGLICNKNGVTLKDYHEAKKFYTGGVIDSCETIVNGERQIDADSINKLTECVMNLPQTKSYYLDSKGNYTSSRKQLHKKIINQVKKGVVCIDKGKPIAVLMGGSPASGKTTFLKKYRPYLLSESIFKVDADEIRSMLPEYKGYNASQTHEETSDIVNTLISDKNIGIPCEFDFIYDGTMSSPKKYFKLVELLKNLGYEVFIIFMNGITEKTAKERALQRYKKSGRFVPMSVIEDFFRNGKETLNKLKNLVDGYIVVDGSTPEYNIIEQGGIRLPNERIYEELGNVKLKEGGNTTRKDIIRDTKNKLSKAFTLPIEMSVYVPSTASANEEISEEEFNDRIEEVEVYLSNLFGGFSKVDISGGYNSEEKGLIQESVAKVTAFATKKSFEENKNKLIEKLSYWCKEWGQESMGYEFEGDLYYIDKNFKLENGGGVGDKKFESAMKQQQENINTNSRNKTAIIKVVNDVKKNKHRLSEDKIYAVSKGYIVKSNMSGGVRVYSSNGKYIETEPKNNWSYPNAYTDMHKHIATIDFKGIVHNIDKMAHGGGIDVKIPTQGTMISKDKKNKIDYKKVGNNYELIVYEGEPNAVENYSRTSFKKKSNGVVTMNHNQFINYIYTEGYVDDKMADGGGVGKKPKTEYTISDFIKLQKQKLREHNSKAHPDDQLDWNDWKYEIENSEAKDYGIFFNKRMQDNNGDRGVFEYMPINKNYTEDFATGGATMAQKRKVGKVMHEWKAGKLHSGSKKGPIVKDQKQAVAIALSEAGLSKNEKLEKKIT